MEQSLLALLHAILHSLSPVHYFSFFIAFIAWLLLVMITFALRKSKIVLGVLSLVTFVLFFIAPLISYGVVERVIKTSEIEDMRLKQLHYIDKVIIKGNLVNHSRRTLKECRLLTYGYASTGHLYADMQNLKKSLRFTSLSLGRPLGRGES